MAGYIVLALSAAIALQLYRESDFFQLTCAHSEVDGREYCVRERPSLDQAVDKLAGVSQRMSKLVGVLETKYPDRDNCRRLVRGFNPRRIYETLPTSEHKAYSENKGEKLAFCLNADEAGSKLIDTNTLTFVALHELAHIATSDVGHTPQFWANFRFLLEEAKAIGIYQPVNYAAQPKEYCGMTIRDNPLFDR